MVRAHVSPRSLALIGVAALAMLAGLAAWGSARLHARAHAELVRALAAASGARVSVGQAEIQLSRGVLVARDVVLWDGSRAILRAAELRGHVGTAAVFTGKLELDTLELTGVRATFRPSDLQRFRTERNHAPSLDVLQLPDAQLALDLGELGVVRIERTRLEIVRDADQRRLSLARTPFTWRDARGQLALTCALHAAQSTCEPTLDSLQWAGRSFTAPVRSTLSVDTQRGVITGDAQLPNRSRVGFAYDPAVASELRIDATELPLAQLLASVVKTPLDATVSGTLKLRRDNGAWRGALHMNAKQLHAGPPGMFAIPQLTATAELRFEGASLVAEPLRIQLPHGQLEGRAQIDASGAVSAAFDTQQLDLADIESLAGVRVAGRGRVQLRVGSTSTASVALTDAAIGGVLLGRLTADLTLANDGTELRVERAQVESPEREFTTSGARLDFDAGGVARADGQLQIERLPLAELYRSIGAGSDPMLAHLQARSAGTASVAFRRVEGKGRLELGLSLQLAAASLADYPFERGQLRARIALDDVRAGMASGALELEQLSLRAGGGELELTGKLDRGALAMRLAPRGRKALPLERWPWLRAHAPAFSGELFVNAALSGSTARPRADVQLEVASLAFRNRSLGRIQFAARLADRADHAIALAMCQHASTTTSSGRGWRICGEGLSGQLRADVSVSDAPERAIRGQLELDHLALAAFLPPSAAGKPTHGVLSSSLAITAGSVAQPDRLSASARVRELSVGEGDERIANVAPFELLVRAGQLELRDAFVQGSEQRFTLSASGTLGAKPKFIAEGSIAAGLLTRTTAPVVKAFGDVGVRLEWSVTETPSVRGHAAVRDVVVRAGPATLRKLRGTLALEGERVQVTGVAGVEAELGGGRVNVTGQLDLSGLEIARYDLDVKAERVSFEPEPLVDLELDAQNRVLWSGGTATPELSGRVKINRLVYRRPLHPENIAQLARKRSAGEGADRLRLDLTIEHEQPVRIQNSLIDGEVSWAGAERSLRVLGSDRQLGLLGQLAVTRGRVRFQGDEFQVQHGTIDFRDPKRIAPTFDLLAVAERARRPDARVVLSASGTERRFDVAVRCDVPPPNAEPPPFNCHYEGAGVRCDDLDKLVAQFVCTRDAARNPAK